MALPARLLLLVGVLVATVGTAATAALPAGVANGRLHVRQVLAKNTPLPVEGAIPVVAIVRGDGSPVAKRRLGLVRPSATFSLPPGRYRLLSWQRVCDGNCGILDPPSDRCSRAFTLHRNQRLRATIAVRYGSGCRISFG
jgi:hypothetical protein